MLTRTLHLCAALAVLAALAGCTAVDPSNPYDPGTPPEQQAAGTLTGAVVLPAGFGAQRLGGGAVELWRSDEAVARIALTPEVDAEPPRAPFAFESVVGGRYILRVDVPGFGFAPAEVTVAIGESVALGDLRLLPAERAEGAAPSGVEGTARRAGAGDAEHGGIRVDVVDTPYATVTTAEGAYRLDLPPGSYTLRLWAAGHGTESVADVAVLDGYQAAPEVVLSPLPARVRATVLRADGQGGEVPAEGATATVADAAGEVLATGPVGEDGALALPVPAQGAARLTVSLDRFTAVRQAVTLVAGETTDVGALTLDVARGALRGVVRAPGLAQGGTVTVVARGAVGDGITAGLRHVVTPPPGDGAWRLPSLPAGGWTVTAVAAEHLPSPPQPVQVAAGQVVDVELALAAREVAFDAPAVVAADTAPVAVTGDADLTHARAWIGAGPGAFQPLDGGTLDAPLPAQDGAAELWVQAANAQAADPAQADDPLAYASPPERLTVTRDTVAPDVWAVEAPALVAAPQAVLVLDCRDALAPSDGLSVAVTVNGEPAFDGPYAPRVAVPLADQDGDQTLQATCTDWAGHTTQPRVAVVRLDRAGPTVQTFQVAGGAPNVLLDRPQALVTLALEDADEAVATAIEEGPLDCANANYRWPAQGEVVVPLRAGDGPRQLSLCAVDRAGNTTGPVQSNPFIVDTTAPAPGRLLLAEGEAWTRTPTVAVQVDADEPGLRLAVEGDVAPFEYAPGEWPSELFLLGGDGPKVVSARLIDAAGNSSRAFSDTVTLDRQAPAASRVVVADGRAEVSARLVPVSIAGTDPDRMRFWEGDPAQACAAVACGADGFEPFSPATELTLSAAQGPKRVCWQLCDLAGNATPVGQADLVLGTYLPRPAPRLDAVQPSVVQAFQGPAQITLTGAGIAADTRVVISHF